MDFQTHLFGNFTWPPNCPPPDITQICQIAIAIKIIIVIMKILKKISIAKKYCCYYIKSVIYYYFK